jgi:hypothetical protein
MQRRPRRLDSALNGVVSAHLAPFCEESTGVMRESRESRRTRRFSERILLTFVSSQSKIAAMSPCFWETTCVADS